MMMRTRSRHRALSFIFIPSFAVFLFMDDVITGPAYSNFKLNENGFLHWLYYRFACRLESHHKALRKFPKSERWPRGLSLLWFSLPSTLFGSNPDQRVCRCFTSWKTYSLGFSDISAKSSKCRSHAGLYPQDIWFVSSTPWYARFL